MWAQNQISIYVYTDMITYDDDHVCICAHTFIHAVIGCEGSLFQPCMIADNDCMIA